MQTALREPAERSILSSVQLGAREPLPARELGKGGRGESSTGRRANITLLGFFFFFFLTMLE